MVAQKLALLLAAVLVAVGAFLFAGLRLSDSVAAAESARNFVLIDRMRYKGKPDLSAWGFREPLLLGASYYWPEHADRREPLPNFIEANLQEIRRKTRTPTDIVIIDIEHWPVEGDEWRENVERYRKVIRAVRKVFPQAKVGFYGTLPIKSYWAPVRGGERKIRWRAANKRLQSLADEVDIIFPSLYANYDDVDGWVKFAQAMLEEAKQYGKPVYPFVWPQYHESNRLLGEHFIDGNFWRVQLETIYAHADGVIFWSKRGIGWREDWPWWIATKEFVQRAGLRP